MSRPTYAQAAACIDTAMQATWLVVVELAAGATVVAPAVLREQCLAQLAQAAEQLRAAAVPPASLAAVQQAQCAVLDESVLRHAPDGARNEWACEPLQARLLGHHQAGEKVLVHMRETLAAPSPCPYVMVMYQRILGLGFHGRFGSDSSEREALAEAFDARVPGLAAAVALPLWRPRQPGTAWLAGNLLAQAALAAVLLLGAWWGLGAWLDSTLAGLPAGLRP